MGISLAEFAERIGHLALACCIYWKMLCGKAGELTDDVALTFENCQ